MTAPSIFHLPGSRSGRPARPRIFTFNIVVTGRCNASCTYCHYYLAHDRKAFSYDISDEQFSTYMSFVALWNERIEGRTSYRFSGGDPMVLGNRLFDLAARAYDITQQKPFMLTAGKALSSHWVSKARHSKISHVFVSIENPIEPDPGAPKPDRVVAAIRDFNSGDLPIVPGVCVVPNRLFGRLYEICAWFYEHLGRIPIISEVNYAAYSPPTESEFQFLEENLERVYSEFGHRTHLNLFSSISPELSYGGHDPYIFELDLQNSYEMTPGNYSEKLDAFIGKLEQRNYPGLSCPNVQCNWWEFCDNTKWYWQGDRNNNPQSKIRDYCRFKRLVNDRFYRAFVDPAHADTNTAIDADQYIQPHPEWPLGQELGAGIALATEPNGRSGPPGSETVVSSAS